MSRPGFGARLWNFIVVVIIFVVVAPVAASIAFMALLVAWLAQLATEEAAPIIALAGMFGVIVSYVAALTPAALVGTAFAFWQTFMGRVRWPVAAIAGLAVGLLIGALGDEMDGSESAKSLLPLFLLTGLAAVLAPWALARTFVTAEGQRRERRERTP